MTAQYDSKCNRCPLGLISHEKGLAVCVPARGTGQRVLFVLSGMDLPAVMGKEPEIVGQIGTLCAKHGIDSYSITYATKCFPAKQTGFSVKEVRTCRDSFLAQEVVGREWVVPMGNDALRAVMEVKGISEWAGRPTASKVPGFENVRVFPMLDPGAIKHDTSGRMAVRVDVDFAQFGKAYRGEATAATYDKEPDPAAWLHSMAASTEAGHYSIDLETTSLNPRFGRITTVAIRCADTTRWFEWSDALRPALYALLMSGKTMVAHNATFELKWLFCHVLVPLLGEAEARKVRWRVGDTLLMHYLLAESEPHDLKSLSKRFTEIGGYDDALKAAMQTGLDFTTVPLEILGNYNAGDADATWRIWDAFFPQVLTDEGLTRVYLKILEPALWAVMGCEYYGRRVDPTAVDSVRAALVKAEQDALLVLNGSEPVTRYLADHGEINFRSPPQVTELFVDYCGIKLTERTEGGALSVAEKHLLPFKSDPVVAAYLDWKAAITLRNNYLGEYAGAGQEGSGILGWVQADGFLYGSYLLHGTDTGRLSSRDPNLQNFHKILRKVVRSRFPGGKILEADYSQLELRLIAWKSRCKALLDAFKNRVDAHLVTAQKLLRLAFGKDKPLDQITKDERHNGKVCNFGMAYGAYPKRVAIEFGMPLEQAEVLHEAFHQAYPELGRYVRLRQAKAEQAGVLRTFMGRLRRLPDAKLTIPQGGWKSPEGRRKIHAKMAASNTDIQATGSDLNTIAFTLACKRMADEGLQSVGIGLTHDSGTYDVHPDEVERVKSIVQDCMVTRIHKMFPEITVPLEIDIKVGDSWGDV